MSVRDTRLEQVVRFSTKGSMRDGTVENRCLGLETHVDVESDEPPERISKLIQAGERACYTLQALTHPVEARTHVKLNGQDLPIKRD